MILTPQELQDTLTAIKFPTYVVFGMDPATKISVIPDEETTARFLETVEAYAEIVQKVAELVRDWCYDRDDFAVAGREVDFGRLLWDIGVEARKLRGFDD
jgi:hypothetical protein